MQKRQTFNSSLNIHKFVSYIAKQCMPQNVVSRFPHCLIQRNNMLRTNDDSDANFRET